MHRLQTSHLTQNHPGKRKAISSGSFHKYSTCFHYVAQMGSSIIHYIPEG